jgi:hypothetical protein
VQSAAHQPLCAFRVILLLLGVRISVEFHDKLNLCAEEVGDKQRPRRLAAKFESAELAVAQAAPDLRLGGGGILAHRAGVIQQFCRKEFGGQIVALLRSKITLTLALSRGTGRGEWSGSHT